MASSTCSLHGGLVSRQAVFSIGREMRRACSHSASSTVAARGQSATTLTPLRRSAQAAPGGLDGPLLLAKTILPAPGNHEGQQLLQPVEASNLG